MDARKRFVALGIGLGWLATTITVIVDTLVLAAFGILLVFGRSPADAIVAVAINWVVLAPNVGAAVFVLRRFRVRKGVRR